MNIPSNASPRKVDDFLAEVTRWAASRPDLLALALVGSYARDAATVASDVDLVLITSTPDFYLAHPDWTANFGEVARQQIEPYGMLTSVRVWYVGGPEVEYGITGEAWAATPLDEGTRRVLTDGVRVLFERKNLLSRSLPPNIKKSE